MCRLSSDAHCTFLLTCDADGAPQILGPQSLFCFGISWGQFRRSHLCTCIGVRAGATSYLRALEQGRQHEPLRTVQLCNPLLYEPITRKPEPT